MRIILVTVSLALLVIVSAVPVSNLKDELKDAAKQTFIRIDQWAIRRIFSMAKTILDNNMMEPPDMEKTQHFVDHWESRNNSLAQNDMQIVSFEMDFMEIMSKYPEDSPVANVGLANVSEMKKFAGDRLAEFQSSATEMIRVAKKAGYTDDSLDEVYDKFAENNDILFKSMFFVKLLSYLNAFDKSVLDQIIN
ncbi:uncharacterized protein LOC117779554 [Drosophila innubila]|uniref:uncharacterized protein LOC117779554 n=1 Tax=Drosophila innubila TaxID=198719 RepID=UPI00148B6F5F|nr:uncharacterized protein LOC117779554 [Drosophila innubila]